MISDRYRHLRNSESLLTDSVGRKYENSRLRRGILNFVGEINKVLFGTLDENDADHYIEQIRRLKKNSNDNTELLPQQLYVIMSTLRALNETLADVQHTDKLVRKGPSDILTYLCTLSSETARKLDIL